MTAITIAIVDDHPLFREGVGAALSRLGFEIVGTGSTREDAIAIAEQRHPDILLVDISMPGGGLEAIHPILSKNPSQKIVVLTVSESPEDATRALNSGARGYILKGVGARSLADSLKSVVTGETYVSPNSCRKNVFGPQGQLLKGRPKTSTRHPHDAGVPNFNFSGIGHEQQTCRIATRFAGKYSKISHDEGTF